MTIEHRPTTTRFENFHIIFNSKAKEKGVFLFGGYIEKDTQLKPNHLIWTGCYRYTVTEVIERRPAKGKWKNRPRPDYFRVKATRDDIKP